MKSSDLIIKELQAKVTDLQIAVEIFKQYGFQPKQFEELKAIM